MTEKEKLEKLKKLADAMYYAAQHLTTDASLLHKAMEEYHKFIIHEYKEEQASEKKCMYSKGNYTDEDRKVLCDGCEEECEFNKKDEIKSVHAQHTTISSSLNDYLCKAYSALYKENGGRLSFARLQNMAIDITEWQKQQMLAKAVDGVVHHFEKCGVASVHYTDPTGVPMAYFTSPEGLSAGDKVKIIVIKEG